MSVRLAVRLNMPLRSTPAARSQPSPPRQRPRHLNLRPFLAIVGSPTDNYPYLLPSRSRMPPALPKLLDPARLPYSSLIRAAGSGEGYDPIFSGLDSRSARRRLSPRSIPKVYEADGASFATSPTLSAPANNTSLPSVPLPIEVGQTTVLLFKTEMPTSQILPRKTQLELSPPQHPPLIQQAEDLSLPELLDSRIEGGLPGHRLSVRAPMLVFATAENSLSMSYLVGGLALSVILGVVAATIGIIMWRKQRRLLCGAATVTTKHSMGVRSSARPARVHHHPQHSHARQPLTTGLRRSILRTTLADAESHRGVSWWDSPPEIRITVPSPVVDAFVSVTLPPLAPSPEPIPPRKYSDGAILRTIVEEQPEERTTPPTLSQVNGADVMIAEPSELDITDILAKTMRRSVSQDTFAFPRDYPHHHSRPSSQSTVSRSRQNSETSTSTNVSDVSFWDSRSATSSSSSLVSARSAESIVMDSEAEMSSEGEVFRVIEVRRAHARSVEVKHAPLRRASVENMPPRKADAFELRPHQTAVLSRCAPALMVTYPSTDTVRTTGSSCPSIDLDDFPTPPAPRRPFAQLLNSDTHRAGSILAQPPDIVS